MLLCVVLFGGFVLLVEFFFKRYEKLFFDVFKDKIFNGKDKDGVGFLFFVVFVGYVDVIEVFFV